MSRTRVPQFQRWILVSVMWGGMLIVSVLAIAWVLTVPVMGGRAVDIVCAGHKVVFKCQGGKLYFLRPSPDPLGYASRQFYAQPVAIDPKQRDLWAYGICLPHRVSLRLVHTGIVIPIWLPLVAVGVPTALLLFGMRCVRRDRCHCDSCGYNLTGNISGICPECGSP